MERAGGSGPRKVCNNVKCGTSSSNSWKPGWSLHSGRTCELCEHCGLVFEQGRFCETFHSDDAGWRTCNTCKKRVHCGCIASLYSFVLLDTGGVECHACAKKSTPGLALKHVHHLISSGQPPQRLVDPVPVRGWGESFGSRLTRNVDSGMTWQPYNSTWYPPNTSGFPAMRLLPEAERAAEAKALEPSMKGRLSRTEESQADTRFGPAAKDSNSTEHVGGDSTDGEQHAAESSPIGFSRDGAGGIPDTGQGDYDGDSVQGLMGGTAPVVMSVEDDVANLDNAAGESSRGLAGKSLFPMQDLLGPGPSTGLSMSIGIADNSQQGVLAGSQVVVLPTTAAGSSGVSGESRDLVTKFHVLNPYRPRHRQLLPRAFHANPPSMPNNSTDGKGSETGPVRVARPPGQGRGRNQLLPRYWPRITDQELQQITSGDSNATITPLFEKMLSASDAGRIGRLVLPKACAEAYFPAISQPEGLPMKIQDITGKEWVFQFRFWPNNNSRMYVLEGVTPCIQSMQLQAGDTVTFSRLDPEGKLVMGYRRAPASLTAQDPKTATRGTSPNVSKGLNVGSLDGPYASTGASLLSVSANAEAKNKSGQSDVSDSGYGWSKAEKALGKEGSMLEALSQVDRKRGRPLGGKSKRLRLENEDSLELKTNWEEAQELLRPPPSIVPSVVTIEGHEFEEYEEPPIVSKRTIFTSRQSGEQDQWAQCDECGNWRRVPPNGVVTARWTCSDNEWDRKRSSCSAPQEISSDDVDHLLGLLPGEEVGIPEKTDGPVAGSAPMDSSGGLDALANAAALGETGPVSTSPSSPARTTKHPRHRPGCTCIVCIQPPSGKGPKHKQNCLCNVCVTVKRRFKTLMLRRKKRLSEREAEGFIRRKRKDEVEASSGSKLATECSGGATVVEGPRKIDPGITELSDIPGLAGFGLAYSSSKMGDDLPVSKGQIDLNCQPEREDEPTKTVLGKMSMKQLLQDASLPLDRYLKQRGMKSLFGSSVGDAISLVGHGGVSNEKKSDEQSSSQCQDQSNEEASETSGRAHGDKPVVSNQAGVQNPVQMQRLMKLALTDSPQSSLLCKYESPDTVSSTMLWSLGLRRTTI